MYEDLTPKEIARIKRESRERRVRGLRQFVAWSAVTLFAVFSGVIFVRGYAGQTPSSQAATVTLSQTTGGEESEGSMAENSIAATPAPAPTAAPAPAPAPAPIVTSQS